MDGETIEGILAPVLGDMQAVAGWLWDRGWAERNAGNLSIDVSGRFAIGATGAAGGGAAPSVAILSDRPFVPYPIPDPHLAARWLLVTATGARFRDIAREPGLGVLLVRVEEGLDGYRIAWDASGGRLAATSELISHLLIHARLRATGSTHRAVLHTHPTHLIALNQRGAIGGDAAALNRALWSMMPEVKVFLPEGVGLAPYRLPGSRLLAEATVAAVAEHRLILWDKHGCVAVERDIQAAFDLIDTANKAAMLYLLASADGLPPRGLSDEELHDLADLARRLEVGRAAGPDERASGAES